jgi:hypothetical protein
VIIFEKILAAHRWSDTAIEIENTNIEFDEKTLNEFQRNINDIEENLKLFINNPWHHAKKYTLPRIIDFDQSNQVNRIITFICIEMIL